MTLLVVVALLLSFLVYLFIGFHLNRTTKSLGDLFPLMSGKQAAVKNSNEFSASTVATTISLATVVIAFFELAPYFGIWLFWSVLTTALGIFLVRIIAPKVWKRLLPYKNRPSLHEFLGKEYGSKAVTFASASCTSLAFIIAFSTELTVGSRFIANLATEFPEWIFIILFSVVAFTYTTLGGFRAVVLTDKLQMISIWLLLGVLSSFYFYFIQDHGGWESNFTKIQKEFDYMTFPSTLPSFLIGLFIMNVFAYVSDMSIWQRISAAQEAKTVMRGLWSSVLSSSITWSILIILSYLTFLVIVPKEGENPLITLMKYMANQDSAFNYAVIFIIILGLFGAMLSTASTQLIAVSHTIYEDLITRFRRLDLSQRLNSVSELRFSRWVLILSAILGVIMVEMLQLIGFSIADLVFAIYGAQLGLLPPIFLALFSKSENLKKYAHWVAAAVLLGFFSGWGSAIYGKVTNHGDLVFLSPCVSLAVSFLVLGMGFLVVKLGLLKNKSS